MTITFRARALPALRALAMAGLTVGRPARAAAQKARDVPAATPIIRHRALDIDGIQIHFREAGPPDAPAILLLHGFPTSSYQYRELIPRLADRFRVIAPDYPGFGHSDMPTPDRFAYTFDGLANVVGRLTERLGVSSYALYMNDYGVPVGFRIAVRHPERVRALIVQNGNAYEEGMREFWAPLRRLWSDPSQENRARVRAKALSLESTRWHYLHGVRDSARISPDGWVLDQALLDRPGNAEIQLALLYDYRTNVSLYPEWQAYLRRHRPPTLVVWGRNDPIFHSDGALAFRRDVPDAEVHLLDTGHFALEEDVDRIATLVREFLLRAPRASPGR